MRCRISWGSERSVGGGEEVCEGEVGEIGEAGKVGADMLGNREWMTGERIQEK